MSVSYSRAKYIIFLIVSLMLFASCKQTNKIRIDVSDSIEYIETPSYYSVDKVSTMDGFKHLSKDKMKNLNSLLKNRENYIWLKIEFTIPRIIKYKDLGLYISCFKTADRVWINKVPCGSYGKFPPNELSAGFGAQHFTLNASSLNAQDNNTIYIQVWTGCPVNLDKTIFIGTDFDAYQTAERRSFFSSKIILCFACISFLAFFIYILLYFFLRKNAQNKTYIIYSILMLFSVITLLPFCLYEIPWLKPQHISYFTIMKILLSVGIYTTILFVNLFMVSFLQCHETKAIKISRIILYSIPLFFTLTISNYDEISVYMRYCFPIIFIQFLFTLIKLIEVFKDSQKRKLAISLLLSLIPAVVGFIIDLFANNFIHIQVILPYASIYGWQITTYIFIAHLLKRFSVMYTKNTKLKNDMVKFNAKLENEVELRTKELSEKNFILSRGLEAITLVQQEVLPKKNKTFMGWDIAVNYIPLDNEVSGDLYDYYFTGSVLHGLSIIDVSGHGIPAGLMTILAKGIISQQFLSGLTNNKTLTEILTNINDIYIQEKVNVENYFTGLLFSFSAFDAKDSCKVNLANAGHPAPIFYNSKEDSISQIKYKDPEMQYGFIGVDGFPISFPTTEFSMSQNDVLVCFTDGITEAMNEKNEEFSRERLERTLANCKDSSAEEIKENIMKELLKFTGNKSLADDLTLIVLKRNDSSDYLEEI